MAVRKVQLEYCYKSNYFAPSDDILTLQRYGVFLKLPNFRAANAINACISIAESWENSPKGQILEQQIQRKAQFSLLSREKLVPLQPASRAVIFGWTHQPSFGNHGGKYDVVVLTSKTFQIMQNHIYYIRYALRFADMQIPELVSVFNSQKVWQVPVPSHILVFNCYYFI